MADSHSNAFLRRAMLADATASGATAILMVSGAGLVAGILSLPEPLLRYAGLILVPYVAFVVFIATRQSINASAVRTIIACNMLWAAASILLLFTGWINPNALGYAFIVAQALVVAILGELQYVGLRRHAAAILA